MTRRSLAPITHKPSPSDPVTSSSSSTMADPTPSAIPESLLPDRTKEPSTNTEKEEAQDTSYSQDSVVRPPPPSFQKPLLRLQINNLDHPGSSKFLSSVNLSTVFSTAVNNVLRLLYRSSSDKETHPPPTRSVTLILRDMGGVAYTTGSDLASDHNEIHFSLSYIDGIKPPSRLAHEITGVLTHELVHCYQWNAKGTCPGGLIEGIADWVRLNCDLSPPHWKKEYDGEWDRGYQHTAYFLQYLETRFGEGTVRRLNEKLRQRKYDSSGFWHDLLGWPVKILYDDYVKASKPDDTIDQGTQT